MMRNYKKSAHLLCMMMCLMLSMTGLAQSITIGTGTTTTTDTGSDPVDGYYNSMRYQVVYTAAELTAAGLPTNATFTGIGFSVSGDYGGGNLLNYSVRVGNTAATNCAAHITTTLTTVVNPFSYNPTVVAAGSFDMITFNTNYAWDGVSNIVVDICTGNTNPFTGPYGAVRTIAASTTNGSRFVRCDGCASQCGVNTNTTNTTKPQVRFNYSVPPPCAGTPTAGTITGATTACSGNNLTLGLSGTSTDSGITIQWASSATPGGPYTNMGTATTQATGALSATMYYVAMVTCTLSGMAATTPEHTITVTPSPTVGVTPTTAVICPGNPAVTLTATGGAASFTWGPAAGLSGTTGASVTANPASTTTYTVTGTTAGCSATATTVVSVGTTPPVPVSATPSAVCIGPNSSTLTAGPAAPAPYCQPVTSCTFPDQISNVTFAGINRNSTCDATSGGWSFYAAPNPTLAVGTPYPISVTTSGDTEGAAVWIDYNRNNVFEASEMVLNGYAGTNPATYVNTVTLPASAINGPTRMRVRCQYAANPSVLGPCANTTYGETEDYAVTISGGVNPTTYSWSPATFLSGTTGATVTATNATTTTTYTVTATSGLGCTNTATVTLTVNSLPTVTATPSASTVCQFDNLVLTGGGASTYMWSGGAMNGVGFPASTTTTYTVTGTDVNGCMNTATTMVTVNPAPTVTASSSASAVCQGDNVTLTGGGTAVSYAWSGGAMDATPFAPAATATYTVTGTDGIGCTNTATVMVTVNALPSVTAMAMPMAVCPGASTTLMGMGASTYMWSGGVMDMMPFVPMASTTYTVTGTDGNGCMNTATQMVTVYTPPTVTANTTASAVCIGDMVTLTGGGATMYSWDNGVTDGMPFSPMMDTTYVVVGTDGNGCMDTASVMITVNPLPIVTATSSNDSVCIGDSTMVMGMGASTYMWSGGVMDMMNFMPTASTTYTVTGTDVNGCMNTATTMVVVNAQPVVMANASATTVCVGTMVTFTGSGASMYSWDMGVMDGVPAAVNDTTMYTVVGTDMNGCMDTAMITVMTNPLPMVTASVDNDTVCTGAMVTFMGSGAMMYMWDNGVTDGVPVMAMDTTYMVVGTDMNGCMDTASVMVQVNMLPAVVANSSASAVCMGAPVTLMGGGASMYTWTGGAMDGVAFTPSATMTYTVTGTDVNGCMNTASTTVTVNTLPSVTAMSDNDTICSGSMVTLMGGGAATYVWTSGVTNAVAFAPSASATYTVTGTDINGCTGTATTMVVVNTLPTVSMSAFSPDTVCFQLPGFTLTGGSPAGGVYSGTGVITGLFNPSSAGVGTFAVTYTTTGANGCTNSASANINVQDCTGIEENGSSALINVYPNPTSGSFNLMISNANFTEMVISIVDIQGKEVFGDIENNVSKEYNTQINLENLAKGIYYIKLTTNSDVMIQKLIIQ